MAARCGETASRSNVQVFATTHSYDCIRGLGSLVRSRPNLADDPRHPQDASVAGPIGLHSRHGDRSRSGAGHRGPVIDAA